MHPALVRPHSKNGHLALGRRRPKSATSGRDPIPSLSPLLAHDLFRKLVPTSGSCANATKRMSPASVRPLTAVGWQRELKDGAVRRVRRRPETPAMDLDDRSADREPNAHAVGFGREEGLEDAIGGRRI